ncbi:MAG: EAL domain-containing protein, partial [Parasporobacterium sp.]|nr:EAL domain-containing protein [Parasporobacterium sp.]
TDKKILIDVVKGFQEAGFHVEIDDFGKGASSLSILKDVRADIVKLDMGFLTVTRNAERSRVILETIVDLAKQLEMEVIAEGVEYKEQLEALAGMGCGLFQGFYFSRPLPVSEFEERYRKWFIEKPAKKGPERDRK